MFKDYVSRHDNNPLIKPSDIKASDERLQVVGVFNAAVTVYEGKTILLLRVAEESKDNTAHNLKIPTVKANGELSLVSLNKSENKDIDFSDSRVLRSLKDEDKNQVKYLTSLSHFRLAYSDDGVHFKVEETPSIFPEGKYETWGIEDPRITKIDDTYQIVYTSVSPLGVTVSRIETRDFHTFHRKGLIFGPENKDVVLFPEKIKGRYHCLHRPVPSGVGTLDIWGAQSDNMLYWGEHTHVLSANTQTYNSGRIGAGAPPIKTEEGYLHIYHAASKDNVYSLGAFLTPLDDPFNIVKITKEPFMLPLEAYEVNGFFDSVVFSCGVLLKNDRLYVYYGAADESIGLATIKKDTLLGMMDA